jgi:hypothetical protein
MRRNKKKLGEDVETKLFRRAVGCTHERQQEKSSSETQD